MGVFVSHLFFIRVLNFCSATRTTAADGSIKQMLSGCCPDMNQVAPLPTSAPCSGFLRGRPLEVPDLFDQVSLFIIELFILCSIILELAEKLNEFGLVLEQDVQNGLSLVGVGHKHLEVEDEDTDVKINV